MKRSKKPTSYLIIRAVNDDYTMRANSIKPKANVSHQAYFLTSQFLHYAQAMDCNCFNEQERTLLILYYMRVIDMLDAFKIKHQYD